ncbi:hypothetical protein IJH89_01935 [Candidatus Saccharibacteria bacterium]|nr:hypothetical protein [Candidatus Saccharibacteria bacterium]
MLRNSTDSSRLRVHGFEEEGSTTTPLEMLALNHNSRFDLAAEIAREIGRGDLAEKYLREVEENREYTRVFGVDKVALE